MSKLSSKLALTIAIKALRPHIFSDLTAETPLSAALKKMKDESIRDIKWHAESYAEDEGYETYVPYNDLRLGAYVTVKDLANDIQRFSDSMEDKPASK